MGKTSKSTTRKLQRESTHRQILGAARSTFKQHGFKATTIREVAKAAKVATGTVMAHCSSKEDLLYEVLHEDIKQIAVNVFASIDNSPPIATILQFLGGSFLDGYAAEPDLYADFLENSLFARGAWGERFVAQVHDVGLKVGGFFSVAIQRGELRAEIDIRAATLTFFANYYFVLIGQIKSRFSDVEAGKAQLELLIKHQISGLKK